MVIVTVMHVGIGKKIVSGFGPQASPSVSSLYTKAAFRLACRSPHCRFYGDFCTTAQAPLATEERPSLAISPSSKQRQANPKQ